MTNRELAQFFMEAMRTYRTAHNPREIMARDGEFSAGYVKGITATLFQVAQFFESGADPKEGLEIGYETFVRK